MRLKRNKTGGIAKALGCGVVLTLAAAALFCPDVRNTFATVNESTTPITNNISTDFDFTVYGPQNGEEVETSDSREYEFVVTDQDRGTPATAEEGKEFDFTVNTPSKPTKYLTEVDVNFSVSEYIKMTTLNDEPIDVTVTADDISTDNFATGSATFNVATNAANGFGVYVYADGNTEEATDSARNLSSSDPNVDRVIAPIDNDNTLFSDFADDRWGYNVSLSSDPAPTTFSPIKSRKNSRTPIYTWDGPVASQDLTLTCGTKISPTLPVATYETDVYVSVIAPFSAFVTPAQEP